MFYRFAKRSDVPRIVELHYAVRDFYSIGFFSKTRRNFLKTYYNILVNDPNEIILCAVENNEIRGFCSGSLDVQQQKKLFKEKKFSIAFSLLSTFLFNPKLIIEALKRYSSLDESSTKDAYTIEVGARSEYWTWDKKGNDSEYSIELLNKFYHVFRLCGINEVFFEVDEINKKILKIHKINGAIIQNEIILPDGRKRIIMKYNLIKKFN